DLYLFLVGLRKAPANQDHDLEDYLRALWQLGARHAAEEMLSLGAFATMLETAFRETPPPFDPSWRNIAEPDLTKTMGFQGWQQTILWQIIDLRDMDEAGMLRDEMRYLGIQAPRGTDWYNFDPLTYLECAAAGAFGGFRAGDESGRIKAVPSSPDDPVFEIPQVTWDAFTRFLWAGQLYE